MSRSPLKGFAVVVCAAITALSLSTRAAGQTEDFAKGASLMTEARKAIGGEDKLADVKRLQIKGTMRRGQGNLTLEGDSEIFLEPPDKFRRNELLSVGLGGPAIDRVEILNGTDVIDENNNAGRGGLARGGDFGGGRAGGDSGGGFRLSGGFGGSADGQSGRPQIDPDRVKDTQRRTRQAEVARLLVAMLLNANGPVAWIGTAQSPEGTAEVLEIKTTEGTPIRLFLDSATHMPLMLTWSGAAARVLARGGQGAPAASPVQGSAGPAPQGRPAATLEMHLSDYKIVGGLKLPHLITRGTNGETSEEWTVKSYKINPTFKGNTFTK